MRLPVALGLFLASASVGAHVAVGLTGEGFRVAPVHSVGTSPGRGGGAALRSPPQASTGARAAPGVARVHPFAAPLCPDITAIVVSEEPDFERSRATLRGPRGVSARARRFGGSVGALRVVYVGHNPLLGSPAVWLTDGSALCQAVLRRPPPPAASSSSTSAVRARVSEDARALTDLVEAVDRDSFRVDRRLLFLALGDASELDPALRGVRGRLTSAGFQLARVPPESLPAALGLHSGDRLSAVNGRPIAGPEGLVSAYAELQRGAATTLTVVRGGRRVQLRYSFE